MTTVGTLVRERKRVSRNSLLFEIENLRERGIHHIPARRVAKPEISTERSAMERAFMPGRRVDTPRARFRT